MGNSVYLIVTDAGDDRFHHCGLAIAAGAALDVLHLRDQIGGILTGQLRITANDRGTTTGTVARDTALAHKQAGTVGGKDGGGSNRGHQTKGGGQHNFYAHILDLLSSANNMG